ncbi:hypothetical protein FQZ97_825630 [compost metagenome]
MLLLLEQLLPGFPLDLATFLHAGFARLQDVLGRTGQLAHVLDVDVFFVLSGEGGMGGQGGDGLHQERTGALVRVLAQFLHQQAGHGLLLPQATGHLVETDPVPADRRPAWLLLAGEVLLQVDDQLVQGETVLPEAPLDVGAHLGIELVDTGFARHVRPPGVSRHPHGPGRQPHRRHVR